MSAIVRAEVEFARPVYAQRVEIGEVRGAGSIVGVKLAMADGRWGSLFKARIADDRVDERQATLNKKRIFRPLGACEMPFPSKRLRLELDTRTVTDWNGTNR